MKVVLLCRLNSSLINIDKVSDTDVTNG